MILWYITQLCISVLSYHGYQFPKHLHWNPRLKKGSPSKFSYVLKFANQSWYSKINNAICRQNENYWQLPFCSPFLTSIFINQATPAHKRYIFVLPEAVMRYVFNFPVNMMVQIRCLSSTTLYWFILVVPGNAIWYINDTCLVSASIMHQYGTGSCRFQNTVTPLLVFLVSLI